MKKFFFSAAVMLAAASMNVNATVLSSDNTTVTSSHRVHHKKLRLNDPFKYNFYMHVLNLAYEDGVMDLDFYSAYSVIFNYVFESGDLEECCKCVGVIDDKFPEYVERVSNLVTIPDYTILDDDE